MGPSSVTVGSSLEQLQTLCIQVKIGRLGEVLSPFPSCVETGMS